MRTVVLGEVEAVVAQNGSGTDVSLGAADYVSHEGDRLMAITWRLRQADAD